EATPVGGRYNSTDLQMRQVVLAFALTLGMPCLSFASEGTGVLTGYTITSWTHRDGLPSGTVWALAEDADGYLWLGTDSGLFRFDGSRFTPWRDLGGATIPETTVRALLTGQDGAL